MFVLTEVSPLLFLPGSSQFVEHSVLAPFGACQVYELVNKHYAREKNLSSRKWQGVKSASFERIAKDSLAARRQPGLSASSSALGEWLTLLRRFLFFFLSSVSAAGNGRPTDNRCRLRSSMKARCNGIRHGP